MPQEAGIKSNYYLIYVKFHGWIINSYFAKCVPEMYVSIPFKTYIHEFLVQEAPENSISHNRSYVSTDFILGFSDIQRGKFVFRY